MIKFFDSRQELVAETPALRKIDDFEAICEGSHGCLSPSDEPNLLRVG